MAPVTPVWPAVTGERHFYDVVIVQPARPGVVGDVDGMESRTVDRLTSHEAAAYVLTELGVPHKVTLDSLSGMIQRWRTEYENQVREPVR